MQIKEVISKYKENINSKVENPLSFINIKSYIPLLAKREIMNVVCNMCLVISDETGLLSCDRIMRDLFLKLNVVLEYADVQMDELFDENGEINLEVALEAYDLIEEFKLDRNRFDAAIEKIELAA